METSFYIIKPHGMMIRDEVLSMIRDGGLTIIESKNLILPYWALLSIYSDLPIKYAAAVFQPFKNMAVEIGLVTGKNSIDRLFQIAGTEIDPVDCAHNTIRFRFGDREPFFIDGVRYYKNVIHRSRDKSEAVKDVGIFHAL